MHNAEAVFRTRPARRNELVAWYARQPEAVRIDIHQRKIDIQRNWQNDTRNKKDINDTKANSARGNRADYAALIAAIAEYWQSINKAKTEKDFTRRVAATLHKKKERLAPRATEIEKMMPLIIQLRQQNLSWRQIVHYLSEHHKKKFSVAYLQRIAAVWETQEKKPDIQVEAGKAAADA